MKHRILILFGLVLIGIQNISAMELNSRSCSLSQPIFDTNINLKISDRPTGLVTVKAVLVICDHYESPDNNNIAQSLRVDLATLNQMLDIIEKRNIVKVEKTVLQGTKATKTNIVTTLKAIQNDKDDIIMYYFTGHGFMEKGKTFMLTSDEKNLGRDEVASIIESKKSRLNMLITDCCSNAIDNLTMARSINRSGQKIAAGDFDQIYKDLFLGYEGFMHLSAATEGEKAFSNNDLGGFFTYHFIKEGLIKKPVNNWAEIFTDSKNKTSQLFMKMDDQSKSNLAAEGIKNQTAKAYSLPKAKSSIISKAPVNTGTIPKGTINIFNYTENNVSFFIDNNDPSKEWEESKVIDMSVDAGKSVLINQGIAIVGYEFEDQDYYFELENGDYFLAIDEVGSLEMFVKDPDINQTNFASVAFMDYKSFFVGQWEWDDAKSGEVIVTDFDADTFVDMYTTEANNQTGTWMVRKQEIEGYDYNFISFIYDNEGTPLLLDYLIDYDDEFPDQVQLIFISAFEGDKQMTYEEAEQFLEPSVIMYRVP
ncbi:MAG: caspase family protein [Saprospiraceae bacterium]|jgi:hypothetical protein|nr:caspase family protein [Saprospiraceae bacterium]